MRRYGAFEVRDEVYRLQDEKGFPTPSRRLEIFSPTLVEWGWPEYALPGPTGSHVSHRRLAEGEMVLLPTFLLATLIHSRSANAPWLYEISHSDPLWVHPEDAERLGFTEKDLVRVETGIGHFVLHPFITEGLRPGIVACSHHLGRWHPRGDTRTGSRWGSAAVDISVEGDQWRW